MLTKKEIQQVNPFVSVNAPKFVTAKRQKTINSSIVFKGISLHTGNNVSMKLSPSPSDSGVIFRRSFRNKIIEIKTSYKNVKSTKLCTLLSDSEGNTVSTVEHIISFICIRD